jgi:hypothetical protein
VVHTSLGKNGDRISKISRAQRAGGLTQVSECLPSKNEALSSNTTSAKNKEKKRENFQDVRDEY